MPTESSNMFRFLGPPEFEIHGSAVSLLVDEAADEVQQQDSADWLLERIGGDTDRLYGRAIQKVTMLKPAAIRHHPRTRTMTNRNRYLC